MIQQPGLLWFDNDATKALCDVVAEAVAHFKAKYGDKPDCIFVHPTAIGRAQSATVGGMLLMPDTSILRQHFFLTIKEADDSD